LPSHLRGQQAAHAQRQLPQILRAVAQDKRTPGQRDALPPFVIGIYEHAQGDVWNAVAAQMTNGLAAVLEPNVSTDRHSELVSQIRHFFSDDNVRRLIPDAKDMKSLTPEQRRELFEKLQAELRAGRQQRLA
jgi:hypothetical protein